MNRVLNDPFNAMKVRSTTDIKYIPALTQSLCQAREESVSDCAAKSMLEKMKDNVGDPAYRERIVKATLASMHSGISMPIFCPTHGTTLTHDIFSRCRYCKRSLFSLYISV